MYFCFCFSELRHLCNQMAIKDMVVYLNGCSDGVAIFDATNHTQLRRADLVEKVKKEKEFDIFVFFLPCECAY